MITVYGIPNCDTVKKTLLWLDTNKVTYTFHDLRKNPVKAAHLKKWVKAKGIDKVVNKKSTTWRELTNKKQEDLLLLQDISLIANNPTIIKRPVIERDGDLIIGYDEKEFSILL